MFCSNHNYLVILLLLTGCNRSDEDINENIVGVWEVVNQDSSVYRDHIILIIDSTNVYAYDPWTGHTFGSDEPYIIKDGKFYFPGTGCATCSEAEVMELTEDRLIFKSGSVTTIYKRSMISADELSAAMAWYEQGLVPLEDPLVGTWRVVVQPGTMRSQEPNIHVFTEWHDQYWLRPDTSEILIHNTFDIKDSVILDLTYEAQTHPYYIVDDTIYVLEYADTTMLERIEIPIEDFNNLLYQFHVKQREF